MKRGNQLATVNRHDILDDRKDGAYIDINVTLGDNRLNDNVVNHYNALNQLTQTLTGNYKVSFDYDADGLRTEKTVNGEKTVYVWDGDRLVMELAFNGKVKHRYVRGNDLVYSDSGKGTDKQYYVTDPHGNVVKLTDEKGNITRTYEYDSFGNEINPDKKDDNPFRYCGEYYDTETGEVYLRARYYQPELGRFMTRDTYTGKDDELLSLHLYTYCENDGVNAWDPSGKNPFALWSSGTWWLCGIDGPFPFGDAIYAVGVVATGLVTVATAVDVSKTIAVPSPYQESTIGVEKKQLSENINNRTIILPDISEQLPRGRHYKLAYLYNDNLFKIGKKLTFVQALTTLGITSVANRITKII